MFLKYQCTNAQLAGSLLARFRARPARDIALMSIINKKGERDDSVRKKTNGDRRIGGFADAVGAGICSGHFGPG
jgi:hypothetical protein